MTLKNKPILYYDSQCKLCTKTKSVISRFEYKRVNFSPLTPQRIIQFQHQLSLSKNLSENVMYYKNKKGLIYFGSEAFFEYLKDKKGLFHILGMIGDFPLVTWFSMRLYTCIAVNRFLLSKLL